MVNEVIYDSNFIVKNIPVILRNNRMYLNLTQSQLAFLLDVSQECISNWETGKRYPSFDKLLVFMQLCSCYSDIITFFSVL